MRYLYVLVIALLVVAPAYAQADCGLESRLVAGGAGKVAPGEANNVRGAASADGELIGQIEAGQVFGVLEGRACSEGMTWVEVAFTDGGETLTGWTVEATSDSYFVEPLAGTFVSAANGEMSVAFVLPPDIASAAQITFFEGEAPPADNPYGGEPAYAEITFSDDYPDHDYWEPYDAPHIRAYIVDSFEVIEEGILGGLGISIAEALQEMFEEQTDLSTYAVIDNNLPDYSPGAATSLLAFLDYLDFGNGEGIRFVSYYAQMLIGPSNTGLLYRYQGLTVDNAFLIDARMPVDAPEMVTEFDRSGEFEEFAVYAAEAAVFFSELPMEEYTPDLTQLDAVMASLWVESVEE